MMPEPRTVVALDAARLPRCHRCRAEAVVMLDGGTVHLTWRHDSACLVLNSADERMRLAAALVGAMSRERRRGAP